MNKEINKSKIKKSKTEKAFMSIKNLIAIYIYMMLYIYIYIYVYIYMYIYIYVYVYIYIYIYICMYIYILLLKFLGFLSQVAQFHSNVKLFKIMFAFK